MFLDFILFGKSILEASSSDMQSRVAASEARDADVLVVDPRSSPDAAVAKYISKWSKRS